MNAPLAMMDTFGIPFAFVIVAALVLWVVIGSKGWWILKAGVVALALLFSVSLWYSLESLEGWPTDETLPAKFEIKWIDVKEPNMHSGEEGEILVWAKNMTKEYENNSLVPKLHSKDKSDEPRLHRLPYSRKLHEQAQAIKAQIAKGGKFYGEMKNGQMKGQGKGKGKGQGQGKGKGREGEGKMGGQRGDGGSLSQEQDPIFHELPPPHFIPKDEGQIIDP